MTPGQIRAILASLKDQTLTIQEIEVETTEAGDKYLGIQFSDGAWSYYNTSGLQVMAT